MKKKKNNEPRNLPKISPGNIGSWEPRIKDMFPERVPDSPGKVWWSRKIRTWVDRTQRELARAQVCAGHTCGLREVLSVAGLQDD